MWRRGLVIGGVAAATATPLVVAALMLQRHDPFAVLDLAQTELRVRNVFSTHPPLIGLPGRIGQFGVHTGSHPGPMSFFVLAPFYRLFGGDGGALFAAAAVLGLVWIGFALWLGWRRGGTIGVVGVGAVLLVLTGGFGVAVLVQPWNPYLPLLAWLVVLLAAWSVWCDDVAMLPILVWAATFCMQTHLPYIGVAGGLAAATVVGAFASSAWRRRAHRPGQSGAPSLDSSKRSAESPRFRCLLRWSVVAAVVAVVLWLPPVIDQIRSATGGNLYILWHDMAHPAEPPIGIVRGIRLLIAHLNPIAFFGDQPFLVESSTLDWGGVAAFTVWTIAVVTAWRVRARSLLIADAVLAASLVIGAAVLSRINGPELWYLMLWAWTIGIAMAATVVWTIIEVARRVDLGGKRRIVVVSGHAVLAVALAALVITSTTSAADVGTPDRTQSDQLARLAPATITAVRSGRLPGDTGHGRLVVTWDDPINYGGEAYGLLDALTGAGIAAGLRPVFSGVVPDRMLVPEGAERGVIHIAVGDDAISAWRNEPGAVEIAHADGRSADAIEERDRLLGEARRQLRRDGEDPRLIDNGMQAAIGVDLGPDVVRRLNRLRQIGLPVAVFWAPPGT